MMVFTHTLLLHEKALYGVDVIHSHKHLCVWVSNRLVLFEGTQLLEKGPAIQGFLKKLQQYKGK